jgi:hypothetical protein
MRPGVLTVRPVERESLPEGDRTCPICERSGALTLFGRYTNLQPIAGGEWRLVDLEVVRCHGCGAKIMEQSAPRLVTEAFWRRVQRNRR